MHGNHKIVNIVLVGCFLVVHPGFSRGEDSLPGRKPDIVVKTSRDSQRDLLGFGWSREERMTDRRARWIKHLEADLWVELDRKADMHFELVAAPNHIEQRRQKVGLYVNNHFVDEWVCPHEFAFESYETRIPAGYLKKGRNRITLRMAYRRRIRPDKREVALAVDKISLAYME